MTCGKSGCGSPKTIRTRPGVFFDATREASELVARHPAIGRLRSYSLSGVRSWVVPGFENYVIFYLPTQDEVQILAVLHGARDLSRAMKGRAE